MGRFFNFEFFIPISRHFTNISLRNFTVDWLLPAVCAFILIKFFPLNGDSEKSFSNLKDAADIIINIVAILIGFTLAILAILVSGSSTNLERIKSTKSDNVADGQPMSIFQEMLNSFTAIVIAEFTVLIVGVVTIVLCNVHRGFTWINFIYGLNLYLIFVLAALNIRNATNLYLVFWTDGNLAKTINANDD